MILLKLSAKTTELLETLESCIDPETEDAVFSEWTDFLSGNYSGDIFRPMRKKVAHPAYSYENININDAVGDYELMLRSQLEGALRIVSSPYGIPGVRANYGTGILPALFGAEIFMMPRETNTLPTVRPMGAEAADGILDGGVPDLDRGFGRQVFEMGEYFCEAFAPYPNVQKYVSVYHPDTQGPLDVLEVLLSSDLFYLMYDEPDKVTSLLRVITDTYAAFLDRWFALAPDKPVFNMHWSNIVYRGHILLRDDSAMNLSPDFYRTFAYPFDAELLDRFDGGMVHFCGRGDHYIDILANAPKLHGINMSQPELNDMEKIYRHTVDSGIPLLGYSLSRAQRDIGRAGAFSHLLSV